ncbi:hypothetical protein [Halobacillus mangrovi]|uniref:hypothetical protein n=1 Tax=Halobacillus mangrovi TaxID=402384 RepID=UPI003D95B162
MNGIRERSAENKEELEMIYVSSNGEMSQRVIQIIEIRDQTILAYCYSRRKVRTFKRENILLFPYEQKKCMEGVV